MSEIAAALLRELELAHGIINNALVLMTPEQKRAWSEANDNAGLIEHGTTRFHERRHAIANARAALADAATPSAPSSSQQGEADAARYRFLRCWLLEDDDRILDALEAINRYPSTEAEIDATIDAALSSLESAKSGEVAGSMRPFGSEPQDYLDTSRPVPVGAKHCPDCYAPPGYVHGRSCAANPQAKEQK